MLPAVIFVQDRTGNDDDDGDDDSQHNALE